jgi:channel protein, hemolysin III family
LKLLKKREEFWNIVTHVIGGICSILGMFILVIINTTHENKMNNLSLIIYCLSLIMLYSCSSLLHFAYYRDIDDKKKKRFRILDHSAIYVLIAGSYTPYLTYMLSGVELILWLVLIWGVAISGVIFQMFFIGKFNHLSTILYIIMGWLVIFLGRRLYTSFSPFAFWLLLSGGILFTVGALFYSLKKPFMHVVWHIFVMLGTGTMYISIFSLIL